MVNFGHDTSATAGQNVQLQRGKQENRFDFVRRVEIMRAGWEDDTKTRETLGSYEQATWWVGRCAADPYASHPYSRSGHNGRQGGSWAPAIEEFRAFMKAEALLKKTRAPRICTLVTDRGDPRAYRVEYIDEDGGIEVAIFSGPNALDRAIYFASDEHSWYDGWNDPEELGGPI